MSSKLKDKPSLVSSVFELWSCRLSLSFKGSEKQKICFEIISIKQKILSKRQLSRIKQTT
jgi:hypothetical protein